MKRRMRPGFVLACCAVTAGCATPARTDITQVPLAAAQRAVIPGRSTGADVIALLGKTKTLRFDSGFEVWVYYYQDDAAKPSANSSPDQAQAHPEFVVLFSPAGTVVKTRIRPVPHVDEKKDR